MTGLRTVFVCKFYLDDLIFRQLRNDDLPDDFLSSQLLGMNYFISR